PLSLRPLPHSPSLPHPPPLPLSAAPGPRASSGAGGPASSPRRVSRRAVALGGPSHGGKRPDAIPGRGAPHPPAARHGRALRPPRWTPAHARGRATPRTGVATAPAPAGAPGPTPPRGRVPPGGARRANAVVLARRAG